jgi:hypothetical protein
MHDGEKTCRLDQSNHAGWLTIMQAGQPSCRLVNHSTCLTMQSDNHAGWLTMQPGPPSRLVNHQTC